MTNSPQLHSAYTTKIEYLSEGTYQEIEYLMEVPELGADAEKIDVTTLQDPVKKHIKGIKDMGDLAFKFLYDSSDESNYSTLKDIEGRGELATFRVVYPDDSTHRFDAYPSLKMDAASVNGALTFTCTMALQSEITECEIPVSRPVQ